MKTIITILLITLLNSCVVKQPAGKAVAVKEKLELITDTKVYLTAGLYKGEWSGYALEIFIPNRSSKFIKTKRFTDAYKKKVNLRIREGNVYLIK